MAASDCEPDDEQRFTQWVSAHGKAVRGFLLAMVRRADLADDLTQEVFCRAWRARHRYREEGKGRAYLLKIADRLLHDRHRRLGPEQGLAENGWREHEPASRLPEPSQAALLAEQTEQLTAAIDRLSSIQQRVLLLRYYGQLSFAEIAQITECPLNTTLTHCHRGLETLRKLLVERVP
jgi:RNA polymerase sigma-70 factor (ECF subfamily)